MLRLFLFGAMFLGFGFSKLKSQLRADFSASVNSGCLPLAVSLTDKSEGNPDKWVWEVGDGRVFAIQNPGLVYLNPGSYTVKLTIFKGNDQSATITKTSFINVYDFPKVNLDASPTEGCTPLSVRFRNLSTAGSGTIASQKWDFGDGNSGTNTNPTHTYKNTGLYSVTLTVENSFGCRSSFSIPSLIRTFDTVTADFGFAIAPSCEPPFSVRFEDKSTGIGITDQKWLFGDGTTGTDKNPEHLYKQSGSFNVTFVKFNSRGCSDTIRKTIIIQTANISAAFEAPNSFCRGPQVSFKNTSNPLNQIDSVFWDFGDGSSSKLISPSKGFALPGDYNVRLTTYFGTCQKTASKVIRILPGAQTSFSGGPVLESCKPPLTVTFKNETPGGRNPQWRFGNVNRTGGDTRSHTFEEEGVFSVRLITSNDAGCLDTLVKPNFVKIVPLEITRVPGLPFEGCFPYTTTLRPQVRSASPIVKWEWDFGDGRTSDAENPTITYNQRGIFVVKLRVSNQEGCVDEASFTVQGGFKPKIDFSADPLSVCTSGEVSFTGSVVGNYTGLFWQFGDGKTATDILNPINAYKDTGFMNVTFFAFDFGCVDSLIKEKYIYVSPPFANFNIITNCNSRYQRAFRDSSFGGDQWLWEFGDGQTSTERNPVHNYAAPGEYRVKLTVSSGVCLHEKTEKVVIMDDYPDFEITSIANCTSNALTFEAKSTRLNIDNIQDFTWRFSDDRVFRDAGPIISRTFFDFAQLSLRLTIVDSNGCSRTINKPVPIVLGGPKARIIPDSIVACVGSALLFPDSSFRNPNSEIIKWTWNFGNGTDTVFTKPGFQNVYDRAGVYDLKLTVEDKNGCIDSITLPRSVQVFETKADFWFRDTVICPNTPLEIFNESFGIGLKYFWDFGDGTTSTERIPGKAYQLSGVFDVSLKITDTANCSNVLIKPGYMIVGGINAGFSVSDSFAACPPLLVSFTNKSIGAISYLWDFGNGNTSILPNPVQTYTVLGAYHAKLVVTGKGGCTDTASQKILIQGPTGEIEYAPLTGCPPLKVSFSSNTKNVKTYIWDFSDGTTIFSPDSAVTHTYLNPGTYRPRVIFEDGDNCRISIVGKEDIKVVGVRSLIKELPNYVFCDTAFVEFKDSSLTNDRIKTWRWDFGDGDTSNAPNPSHIYRKPGRYKASLFVETFDQCSSLYFLPGEIVVASSPEFQILSDSSGCLPVEMVFRTLNPNQDTTTLSWKWNFGNGASSTLEKPEKVIYQNAGKYTVSATATDNYGCTKSIIKEINIYAVPAVSVEIPLNTVFCDSGVVRFTPRISTQDPIENYIWDFGDGNQSSLEFPVNHYKVPGRYLVALEVKTVNGCSNTYNSQTPIIISETPRISMLQDSAFCTPNRVFISAEWLNQDTSKLAWVWNFGGNPDAVNIDNKTPVPGLVWFRTPGKYTVSGTVKNEFGCASSTSRIITVVDTPQLKITSPPFICLGQAVPLLVTGAQRYQWVPKEGLNCYDCPNPVASPTDNVTYKVKGVNQDGATCEREIGFSIQVVKPFNLSVSRGDTLCIGESFQMRASGAQQYSWSPATGLSATNISNPVARPDVTTNYVLIASDTFNCFKETVTVPVVVYPKPRVEILERTFTGNIGTRFSVQTNFSDVTRWRWTPSTGLSCTNCQNPDVFVLQNSMKYRVQVTNPGGCEASDEFSVEPICQSEMVFIPNTFSPNADGSNDIFYPMSNGSLIVSSIRVFNRWGQLVFERRNFSTNDPSAGWNGTFQGVQLPPDVFVYIAELPCSGIQKLELRGNITLLR